MTTDTTPTNPLDALFALNAAREAARREAIDSLPADVLHLSRAERDRVFIPARHRHAAREREIARAFGLARMTDESLTAFEAGAEVQGC